MGGIIIGQEAAAARATGDDTVTALQEAIGVISSVCDYAQSDDAQGFNAADAWLGHVLAQMPAALWTDDAALATWDMLRKYRGQLAAAGIGYDDLPRPAGADELEAGRREQARQRAREHAQHWREQQYRQARTYLRCDADGGQVTLAFPYDPDLVAACRAIPGRRYDGAAKANVFPFTSLPAVIKLADAHQIEVTAEVRALAGIATERAGLPASLPPVRLDDRNRTIIIDAPFNPDLNQALKDANHGRSTWDRNARVHRLTPRAATALPELAQRFGLEISEQAREAITAETARQDQNRADASAFEADPVPVPGLAAGAALKAQQYPVVRFALAHRRVLIGDDMGWGKTLSSLAAVAADGAYPAVVVCRPSLTLNWAAEISRFFPALTVHLAAGTTPAPVPPGTDVIIIGSAALAAKPRNTPDGGKEFGWVEALAAAAPKALIIDEGQDTKERAANRSQACEQLAAAVTARDGLVLDLTGTAILNRPRELCQQLTILGRIGEFGGPKAFLWRYCLSETNEWGASYNGARNLLELHDRLRAWGIMVRRSDDAALGLPPCREHVLCIPQADLDPAVHGPLPASRSRPARLPRRAGPPGRAAARRGPGQRRRAGRDARLGRRAPGRHRRLAPACRAGQTRLRHRLGPRARGRGGEGHGRRAPSRRGRRVRRRVRRAEAPGRPVRRAEGGREGGVPGAARSRRAGHLGGDRRRGSRAHADRGPDRHPGRAGLDSRRDPADEKAAAPHRPGPARRLLHHRRRRHHRRAPVAGGHRQAGHPRRRPGRPLRPGRRRRRGLRSRRADLAAHPARPVRSPAPAPGGTAQARGARS